MVNLSILISNSELSGPGGLFDIDATLPLVAIQFLLLIKLFYLSVNFLVKFQNSCSDI